MLRAAAVLLRSLSCRKKSYRSTFPHRILLQLHWFFSGVQAESHHQCPTWAWLLCSCFRFVKFTVDILISCPLPLNGSSSRFVKAGWVLDYTIGSALTCMRLACDLLVTCM